MRLTVLLALFVFVFIAGCQTNPEPIPTHKTKKLAMQQIMSEAWKKKTPKVGEMAPDFTLKDIHDENPYTLSSARNKTPVALIFGSYT
jgi:hypothetical protein